MTTYIIGSLIFLAFCYAAYRTFSPKGGCCGKGCSSCSGCSSAAKAISKDHHSGCHSCPFKGNGKP